MTKNNAATEIVRIMTDRLYGRKKRKAGPKNRTRPHERFQGTAWAGSCSARPGGSLRCGSSGSRIGRRQDLVLVLVHELIEVLQRRIQLAGLVQIAVGHHLLLEVAVGLEHVAHFVRTGEAPATVHVRLDGVVLHRAESEVLRQALAHLVDGQELAGDADGLADVLVAGL